MTRSWSARTPACPPRGSHLLGRNRPSHCREEPDDLFKRALDLGATVSRLQIGDDGRCVGCAQDDGGSEHLPFVERERDFFDDMAQVLQKTACYANRVDAGTLYWHAIDLGGCRHTDMQLAQIRLESCRKFSRTGRHGNDPRGHRRRRAAAEPPLEPPADRVESQGLRVAPQALGIVKTDSLYSGVLVFPKTMTPTSRKRHDSF